MTAPTEISEAQLSRLISAKALTVAQLNLAKDIVVTHFNGLPEPQMLPLIGQVAVALASNYAAEIARTA